MFVLFALFAKHKQQHQQQTHKRQTQTIQTKQHHTKQIQQHNNKNTTNANKINKTHTNHQQLTTRSTRQTQHQVTFLKNITVMKHMLKQTEFKVSLFVVCVLCLFALKQQLKIIKHKKCYVKQQLQFTEFLNPKP